MKTIAVLAAYGAALIGILVLGLTMKEERGADVFGSLEGRFTSDVSLEYDNHTYHYRENVITNYLLIGVDQASLDAKGYQSGGQADFLLMLSIDRKARTITPLMIDRDTMTPVQTYGVFGDPSGEKTMQICLAQAFSGRGEGASRNTMAAVEKLLHGVKADYYMLMDLGGVALLNDAVGGVTVEIPVDMTALDPAFVEGASVLLEGSMAEAFVRGRTTVADGTNASRMQRQHVYLKALLEKFSARADGDDDFVRGVLSDLSGHIRSDAGENRLLGDVQAYGSYAWNELILLPGEHAVGADGFAEYWIDEDAAMRIIVDTWFE